MTITISEETRHILALSMIKGVGPATLRKLLDKVSISSFSVEDVKATSKRWKQLLETDGAWNTAVNLAEQQIEQAIAHNARILSPLDADYPDLLSQSADDPFVLYVKGNLPQNNRSVAIIGTREPTRHGEIITQRITDYFVENNWSIVSGLALGCDTLAHEQALHQGGHTVAVMAHGLHTVAPAKNRDLAERILCENGALVSEFPFGQNATPPLFVKRDRTQAGLAQGVIMVQSGIDGGSLHASRAALKYNRWLAVPYPTPADLEINSPSIQANLVIADRDDAKVMEILRCEKDALSRVTIIRGKEDYHSLLSQSESLSSAPHSAQQEGFSF